MPEPLDFERDLQALDAGLRQLEAEYNMFFAGRRPRPPVETRSRVEQLVKRLDRMHIPNYADRFRFTTLQARYASFVELWDRGMTRREEGRGGHLGGAPAPARHQPRPQPPDGTASKREVVHVASFNDPAREQEKLKELYSRLTEARRAAGEEAVPFDRFKTLVSGQVEKLKQQGSPEVAFRVAMKDGKVTFTARGLKGGGND